jgi:hypothetical protein
VAGGAVAGGAVAGGPVGRAGGVVTVDMGAPGGWLPVPLGVGTGVVGVDPDPPGVDGTGVELIGATLAGLAELLVARWTFPFGARTKKIPFLAWPWD